jgi:hypothetical protein
MENEKDYGVSNCKDKEIIKIPPLILLQGGQ